MEAANEDDTSGKPVNNNTPGKSVNNNTPGKPANNDMSGDPVNNDTSVKRMDKGVAGAKPKCREPNPPKCPKPPPKCPNPPPPWPPRTVVVPEACGTSIRGKAARASTSENVKTTNVSA